MIEKTHIDNTSIKVIKSELSISIAGASRHFEAFISDRAALTQLNQSQDILSDISGILKVINISGAELMVDEMQILLAALIENSGNISDPELSALSHAFVGLPCYIEYVIDKSHALPILVLPFINEMRTVRKQPLVLESEFVGFPTQTNFSWPQNEPKKIDDVPGFIRRQRQMYQIGLIGLIREENLEIKLELMHRALSRLSDHMQGPKAVTVLKLGQAVFESLLSKSLMPTYTRKRVLALIDKLLRQLANDPAQDLIVDDALINELIYLNHISSCEMPVSKMVDDILGLDFAGLNDHELQIERDLMQGPNADTILTMVSALRDELSQTKEVLEIAAQGVSQGSDFNNVVNLFQRTSDIFMVVGLTAPGQILAQMKDKVYAWSQGSEYTKDELLEVADGLIYVESVMSNLNRMDLNFSSAAQDDTSKRKLMASSQLSQAHQLVLQESQSVIAVAKKDISSFVESDFDIAHIQQIVEALHSVRGGLSMLGLSDADAVLSSCVQFVQHIVDNGVDQEKSTIILETLADALIALEYYLSEMELHDVAPPNVLAVAEQSLMSLGFSVS